jgi:hypothetical protein
MNPRKLKYCLLPLLLMTLVSNSFSQDSLRYENFIYEDNIKTVILRQTGTNEALTIIPLHSFNSLKLQFDELGTKDDFYQYTFIHCTYDWKESNLERFDYLQGDQFESINTYTHSRSTFERYVHYEITFPTSNMKPVISGNYLLKVYRNFDEDDLVLTRRFMVIQEQVTIDGTAKPATYGTKRRTSQELDFTIDHEKMDVPNPFTDVHVAIIQNGRWDNAIIGLKPQFASGNILKYNYEEENVFLGGNEFRSFDIRSLRFMSNNVRKKYISDNKRKHVVLYNEFPRGHQTYVETKDFNGKTVIDNKDGSSGTTEGDYAVVHFNLKVSEKYDKELYVIGEMSGWQLDSSFMMTYNAETNIYELEVPLKQGYYNYHFALSDNGETDLAKTEGNYFQTENDYHVLTYHKNQFMGYDALIGSKYFSTRSILK